MSEEKNWMDDLLEQVAAGSMKPQEALGRFFMHKREKEAAALSEEDHAFLTAMDAVEAAQTVAAWCARNAAAQGGVVSIAADLRHPGFFHSGRRPPKVTGQGLSGRQIMLFCAADAGLGGEYGEACLRVAGSFSGTRADPVFLPVFIQAFTTALRSHELPEPVCTT